MVEVNEFILSSPYILMRLIEYVPRGFNLA